MVKAILSSACLSLLFLLTKADENTTTPQYGDSYMPPQSNKNLQIEAGPARTSWTRQQRLAAFQAAHKSMMRGASLPPTYSFYSEPTGDIDLCTYPLEVFIVQDITDSFQSDIDNMIESQIDVMFSELQASHPGTVFSVGTTKDKPIDPFGFPATNNVIPDYCYNLEMNNFTDDVDVFKGVYSNFRHLVGGGEDAAEAQYYGIFAAMQDPMIPWGQVPQAQQLIVVVTDSAPHYGDDGSDPHGMADFSNAFESNSSQCTTEFYPTAQQAVDVTYNVQTGAMNSPWFAFMIYEDNIPTPNFTTGAWSWYSGAIGEDPNLFLQNMKTDGTDFWEKLGNIVDSIDGLYCSGTVRPAASTVATKAPTPATTKAPVAPTEAPIVPTAAPVLPTAAPVVPTAAPVAPTEAPVVPTAAPVAPTEAPVVPTAAPVAPTEAPVVPTVAPVVPTAAPVIPTAAPVIPTAAPVIPTAAPVIPTAAPVIPTAAPVVPTAAPVVPTAAPVAPTVAPVVPTVAPAEPTVAPVPGPNPVPVPAPAPAPVTESTSTTTTTTTTTTDDDDDDDDHHDNDCNCDCCCEGDDSAEMAAEDDLEQQEDADQSSSSS